MGTMPTDNDHNVRGSDAYWVVIPAFNEGPTIRDVAMRARRHCRNAIIVDDASSDETVQALLGLDVTVLRNDRHLGKAGSLWRGFQFALSQGAAGVITLDADGQHTPEEIPSFLETSFNHPEALVVGVRRREQRRAFAWRYGANCVADFWISWAAGRPLEDSQSGFRLYPSCLLKTMKLQHGPQHSFVFESEALIEAAALGVPCLTVPISVHPRSGPRPSHFRPVLDIARITRMVARRIFGRGLYPRRRTVWLKWHERGIDFRRRIRLITRRFKDVSQPKGSNAHSYERIDL
jgi:glycosyltransferase involved in cell wall biosynthesis